MARHSIVGEHRSASVRWRSLPPPGAQEDAETQRQVLPDLLDREVPQPHVRPLNPVSAAPRLRLRLPSSGPANATADGQINVAQLGAGDWARMAERIDTHTDVGLDAADASIVAFAERFNQTVIATLDERDFGIVGPKHTEAFELLPGLA